MARRRRMTGVVAALAAIIGTLAIGATPAAAAVTITVTPSTGLLEGHVVDVATAGLTPGADYVVSQCEERRTWGPCVADGTDTPGSTPSYEPGVAFVTADAEGEVAVRLKLRRPASCETAPCSMRLFAAGSGDVLASTPLVFAAEGRYQWPEPEVAIATPSVLLEGSTVTLTASGLDPWSPNRLEPVAVVGLCRDDEVLDLGEDCRSIGELDEEAQEVVPVHIDVAPDGTGSVTFDLPRHLDITGDHDYDCARQGCVVIASQREILPADHGGPLGASEPLVYAPEWAPWPSAESFVDRAVAPLECQPVTGSRRATIMQALTDRSFDGDPFTAARMLALSSGATECAGDDIGEVLRLYVAFFDRLPESDGLGYWVGRLEAGATATSVARAFGGTPEFRGMYGSVANGTVVDRAYRNTLGRAPDADGRAYWVQRLDRGMARSTLLHHFARSPEMRSNLSALTRYARISWVLAGRAPTRAEGVVLLADGNTLPGGGFHSVVSALLASGAVPRA